MTSPPPLVARSALGLALGVVLGALCWSSSALAQETEAGSEARRCFSLIERNPCQAERVCLAAAARFAGDEELAMVTAVAQQSCATRRTDLRRWKGQNQRVAELAKLGGAPSPGFGAPAPTPPGVPGAAPAAMPMSGNPRTDAQTAAQWEGRWAAGVRWSGPEPAFFGHYFLIVSGDEYIATGAIVKGSNWDNSDIPGFQTVYGHAQTDGEWYAIATDLVYLGPTITDAHRNMADTVHTSSGENTRGMRVFSDSPRRPAGAVTPPAAPKVPVPADAQALINKAGDWARGMNWAGPKPPIFSEYFLVVSGDEYIATGAIVKGSIWDNSSAPGFQTVYGYSDDDGEWYVDVSDTVHLGRTVTPRHHQIADILQRNSGEDVRGMNHFK